LKDRLADNGALAFTFIDPHYHSWPDRYGANNLVWRLEREIFLEKEKGNTLDIDVPALAERAQDSAWFVLVNGEDLYLETEVVPAYEPERQRTIALLADFDLGYMTVATHIRVNKGVLVIVLYATFQDNSGRSDYLNREFFYRST
jgi:hypothetical protein